MVDRPDRLDPIRRIGEEKTSGGPTPPGGFESYMEKAGQMPPTTQPPGMSPSDLMKGQTTLAAEPTFANLMNTVRGAQVQLGGVANQLQTPNLKLKNKDKTALKNHLSTANSYLASANEKLDLQPSEPPPATPGMLGKFFDLVTQEQSNLAAAQGQISQLQGKGEEIQPADFLTMQLKISAAQREIEFASMILGNTVSAMKQLFNIQL